MHDIVCNAPDVALDDILRRQHLLGGIDLDKPPAADSFAYPFSLERAAFVRRFYDYICAAKSKSFALTWSKWVALGSVRASSGPSAAGAERSGL
jgi:hypothetical protein